MKFSQPKQDVSVFGDFKTSEFKMGDAAIILDLFAEKIYTHRERAVIREYSCNAYDSHVVAGTTDIPFKVHLPTLLEPWLSIRDFGTGLSDADVREIFAGIAISTKRNNNDTIGCFGVGSKSAFALTDSFSVKSFYNGNLAIYTCYRDTKRKPVVSLLSITPTDEPNGVEIKFATKSDKTYLFHQEAIKVFSFWEGTLPDINDKNILTKCIEQREKYILKGKDFGMSTSYGDMYAIQGNIAYKIPSSILNFQCEGWIRFNIGELEFDTARENIALTDKTINCIKEKIDHIKNDIMSVAESQVEAGRTKFEKAAIANNLQRGQLEAYLKNLDKYKLPEPEQPFDCWLKKYRGVEKIQTKYVPLGSKVEYFIHKDKMINRIKNYVKETGRSVVIFKSYEQAKECCIDIDIIKDINNIPKIHNSGGSNRSRSSSNDMVFKYNDSMSLYNLESNWKHSSISNNDEIVYVEICRWKPINCRFIRNIYDLQKAKNIMQQCNITDKPIFGIKSCFMKTKQFKKIQSISLGDYLVRELTKIAPKTYHNINDDQLDLLDLLYRMLPNNKNIQWACKISQERSLIKFCNRFGITTQENKDMNIENKIKSFFDKYEMITIVPSVELKTNKDIIERYINSK